MKSRAFGLLLIGSLSIPLVQFACTDDDTAPPAPTADAGQFDATKADVAQADGTVSTDTGTDAATKDAGTDSALDASEDATDAEVADADLGPGVYVHGGGILYRVDPNDAGLTPIGPTGHTDLRMVWDEGAGVLRGVAEALTNPTLISIDRCTGAATQGPRIVKLTDAGADAGPLARGECWGRHPNGTWYAGVDWNGDPPAAPVSESLARLDVDSGGVTRIAFPFKTTQADCDSATFIGTEFYGLDVNGTTATGLYKLDLNDAGDTKVGTPPFDVVRIGYDPASGTLFGTGITRTLYRMDPSDAATTAIGVMAADAAVFDSVVGAPIPNCP